MSSFLAKAVGHKKNIYQATAVIILSLMMLAPMLESGYNSDDILNSMTKGVVLEDNQTVASYAFSILQNWLFHEGRIFPLAVAFYSFFYYVTNLYLYKLIILGLIIVDLLVFGYFIQLLTKSRAIGYLAILVTPLFFQFRLYHDPILSFSGLLQTILLFVLCSLIFLQLYLRERKRYLLALSLLTYTVSLLTYEISYVFSCFHFIIIYFHLNPRKFFPALKESLPYILLSFIFVLASILLRVYCGVPLSGGSAAGAYTPNFNLTVYFATLLKQTSAAFPLSYYLLNPQGIFNNTYAYLQNYFSLNIIFIGIGYFVIAMETFRQIFTESAHEKNKITVKKVMLLGLSMLILPGVLIALSPKYQHEVYWGVGYLPVFISYFGLTMLVVSVIYLALSKLKLTKQNSAFLLSIALSASLGYVGILNYTNNKIVNEHLNSFVLYPRTIIEEAISGGLFQKISSDAYLVVNSKYPWDQAAFYRMHSGIKFKHVGYQGQYLNYAKNNNLFYLSYDSSSQENGYAILGEIKNLSASNYKLNGVTAEKAYIYVRTPYTSALSNISINGRLVDKVRMELSEPVTLEGQEISLISSGVNWRIYAISGQDKLIDLLSLKVNTMASKSESSVFWRTKSLSQLALKDDENVLLHIGFENAFDNNRVELEPLALNDNFTIEAVIKPSKNQSANANIMGNHPGYNNFEGFVIQQDGQNQNVYGFGFGNGQSWLPGVNFQLNAEEWNYLTINVDKSLVKIFHNGLPVASVDAQGTMKNSTMPFFIGNWGSNDRPFNGLINEVRISNGTLSEKAILANWQRIREKVR